MRASASAGGTRGAATVALDAAARLADADVMAEDRVELVAGVLDVHRCGGAVQGRIVGSASAQARDCSEQREEYGLDRRGRLLEPDRVPVLVADRCQPDRVRSPVVADLAARPQRPEDLDHPDELRVDLDPMPGVDWRQIVDVAMIARDVLSDHGLVGWPKTSGSRGIHIYARIEPRWDYRQVRLAAETLAREVERRAPGLATAKWWKEERGESVFVDFNQNAKDRTVASAYSIRPLPDARVSTPLDWDEVPGCRPEEFTVRTVLERFADRGDPASGIDDAVGSLDALLALAEELGPAEKPPKSSDGSGRRASTMPLIEIARARTKPEALEGLERWKSKHAGVVKLLEPADVLVDGMRGSSSLWYRIRVNLQHVPETERPQQAQLEVDYDPWAGKIPNSD